jgi:outer membrane receptor protein involved in Fe transport
VHDVTDQERGFAYASYHIDATSRVSLLLNASYADFQIPDVHGQPPMFTVAGASFTDSAKLNENQNEQNYYSVISYQKSDGPLSLQGSIFSRYGQIHFEPDPIGDLVFQGVASEVFNNFFTNGAQFDASYIVNDQHTVRAGFIGDYTTESLNTNTLDFDPPPAPPMTPAGPSFVSDNAGSGVYVQDEWSVTRQLTLNYGARFDSFNANFDNENQLSPRFNVVYKLDEATTLHAGYARYFVTPPLQNVAQDTVNKFTGSTNDSGTEAADPTKVERSNYYDTGISRQFGSALTLGADGFYKAARNLIDEGQFGTAVIETPFNYARGYVYGAELSGEYKLNALSTFGNFSWVETRARDINSQQFDIDPAELAYIADHYIRLDHEGEYTASAGVSYDFTRNDQAYVDAIYGSGLRAGFANDKKEPQYAPVSLGYVHTFHLDQGDKNVVKVRFDVVNVFDEVYQLRDGTGVGVGAPQFGERRGFFAGVAYDF